MLYQNYKYLNNKKYMLIFIILIICFIFFYSCGIFDKIISNDLSIEQSNNIISDVKKKDFAIVSVTTLSSESITNFSRDKMETYILNLIDVGIDTIILSETATTPYGNFSNIYYPSIMAESNKRSDFISNKDVVENLLYTAEKLNIKVFIGLNNAPEWSIIHASNSIWNSTQSEIAAKMATELTSLYKAKYPNAFYGWYIPWIMSNSYIVYQPEHSAELLNLYMEALHKVDSTIPVLFSTLLENNFPATKTAEVFNTILQSVKFSNGDIYCCIDALGTGTMRIDSLDYYYKKIAEIIKAKSELSFWTGCETFNYSSGKGTALDCYVNKLKIAKKYSDIIVAYSYTKYYAPITGAIPSIHFLYKDYYETGNVAKTIAPDMPKISTTKINGQNAISVIINSYQQTYCIDKIELYMNDELIKVFNNTTRLLSFTEYKVSYFLSLDNLKDGSKIIFKAIAYDIAGNESQIGIYKYT
ncbi:MAG: hypothetical protein A2Y17_06510 [Clostridiales bacterium GWF2_38_85]|nr:MAG: hypothetical protein A2Y17_06510 [Clostridiales bacterium GWF2_38_85]